MPTKKNKKINKKNKATANKRVEAIVKKLLAIHRKNNKPLPIQKERPKMQHSDNNT